jgi:hypothetical protein
MKTRITIFLMLMLFCMQTIISQNQDSLSTHLILFYEFNGSGKNSISDNNHLKLKSLPGNYYYKWTTGRNEKDSSAVVFDGNAQGLKTHLDISPQKLPELTYIAWVYGRPEGFLFGSTLPVNNEKKFSSRSLQISKGAVLCGFNKLDSLKKPYFASLRSSALKKDKWNFIAMTANANDSTLRLYVNDEYYESKPVVFTKKSNYLIIGNTQNSPYNRAFKGQVDEIQVYNKALSSDELSSISGISFADAQKRMERNETIQKILLAGLIIFLFVSVIFMIVVLITEKRYKPIKTAKNTSYSGDSKNAHVDSEVDDANRLASDCVEEAFETWEPISEENGQIFRSPTKRKHFKTTYRALNKAKSYQPTDTEVINRMNDLGGLLNKLSKRKFYGNWFLAILSLIFPVVYFLLAKNNLDTKGTIGAVVMFLPTIAYVLSNFAPNYVVANRKHNSGGVFGKIIAFIMGAAASAVAVDYYTEKTWSDGSKTTEYDTGSNAAQLVIWAILIIAAILLSMVLVIIAATIAFFRNYVFYV